MFSILPEWMGSEPEPCMGDFLWENVTFGAMTFIGEGRFDMRRLFSMMVLLVSVCFFGLSTSWAGEIGGDESLGADVSVSARASIGDSNYVIQVYAGKESTDTVGTRVFSVGDTVYLFTRYHVATTGETTRYRLLTDGAGAVKGLYINKYTTTAGDNLNYYGVEGLPAGVYYFTTVILSPGNHMMAPDGYMFVVE